MSKKVDWIKGVVIHPIHKMEIFDVIKSYELGLDSWPQKCPSMHFPFLGMSFLSVFPSALCKVDAAVDYSQPK